MADTTTDTPLNAVDITQLEKILDNPRWSKRVVITAAQALNALINGAGSFEAQEMLRHCFTDWDNVLPPKRGK